MWHKENKTAAAILLLTALFLAIVGLLIKGGGRAESVRGKIQDAVTAAGQPVYAASSGIGEGVRSIVQFKERTREREHLQQQLNLLRKENADLRLQESEYRELKELAGIFSYDTIEYKNLQAANVIATNTSRWMHSFTIDRGRSSGIEPGNAVVAGDGLIGRISEVSEHYAKAVSLLDEENKVSFHAEKDPKILGLIRGDGKGGLEGYLLGNEGFVKKGERLKTSGIGSYPKGFVIGEVTRVQKGCGQQRIRLKAVPAADPKTVKKVAVIR